MKKISIHGHDIEFYVDASQYDDDLNIFEEAAENECAVLEQIISSPVNSLSFHRPVRSLQGLDRTLAGRLHAYMQRFFSEITYISDSQGEFRFGRALENSAFHSRRSLQLLTHAIWWTSEVVYDRINLIDRLLEWRGDLFKAEAVHNYKPYAEHTIDRRPATYSPSMSTTG